MTGITGGYGGDRRVEYILPHDARKKGTHDFVIESSCNGMFGVPWNGDTIAPPDVRTPPSFSPPPSSHPAEMNDTLTRARR